MAVLSFFILYTGQKNLSVYNESKGFKGAFMYVLCARIVREASCERMIVAFSWNIWYLIGRTRSKFKECLNWGKVISWLQHLSFSFVMQGLTPQFGLMMK